MNLLGHLYVPGRWEDTDPFATTFYVYCGPDGAGVYGHCEGLDLMVKAANMPLLDTLMRYGLCAMFKIPDRWAPILEVAYYNHPVEWAND